jgi:hypothetical protein
MHNLKIVIIIMKFNFSQQYQPSENSWHGPTNFQTVKKPSQNSRCQKSDMYQVPYWWSTIKKFSCPGFSQPWLKQWCNSPLSWGGFHSNSTILQKRNGIGMKSIVIYTHVCKTDDTFHIVGQLSQYLIMRSSGVPMTLMEPTLNTTAHYKDIY